MAVAKPTAELSADELCQMLTAGANAIDRTNVRAAVHLLTFTALPHRRRFAELIDVEDVDGRVPVAAFVRNWKALPGSPAADRLAGGDQRLLALAVSLATGEPVDLAANAAASGYAYARRVIEAIAIATGYSNMYAITSTPALDEMLAANDALFNN